MPFEAFKEPKRCGRHGKILKDGECPACEAQSWWGKRVNPQEGPPYYEAVMRGRTFRATYVPKKALVSNSSSFAGVQYAWSVREVLPSGELRYVAGQFGTLYSYDLLSAHEEVRRMFEREESNARKAAEHADELLKARKLLVELGGRKLVEGMVQSSRAAERELEQQLAVLRNRREMRERVLRLTSGDEDAVGAEWDARAAEEST